MDDANHGIVRRLMRATGPMGDSDLWEVLGRVEALGFRDQEEMVRALSGDPRFLHKFTGWGHWMWRNGAWEYPLEPRDQAEIDRAVRAEIDRAAEKEHAEST